VNNARKAENEKKKVEKGAGSRFPLFLQRQREQRSTEKNMNIIFIYGQKHMQEHFLLGMRGKKADVANEMVSRFVRRRRELRDLIC
jgi:hypothetical protein